MKHCSPFRHCVSQPVTVARQFRRWTSYDKSALTSDALLEEIESGLGEDSSGNSLKLDAATKTISTAVGDLPISPLFDPEWLKNTRRQRKDDAGPPTGRFRKKLANNPYARALGTPIRKCPNTSTWLPRYFLQDFELVKHPETGTGWWAPGPLSTEFIESTKQTGEHTPANDAANPDETAATETAPSTPELPVAKPRPRRGPVTSYILSRKSALDTVGGNQKHVALLLAMRSGMAIAPDMMKDAVWRHDMGDVLLRQLRRKAVDGLIERSNGVPEHKDRYLQACTDWAAVKDIKLRGCVLWLPETTDDKEQAGTEQYATLDIEGVRYGHKMAVHNLRWLLGKDELERLREAAEVFRNHQVLVLRQWNSIGMMRLHLLLWRLQGYLG